MYQPLPLQDPPKFTQILDFWFDNKPSGNPVFDRGDKFIDPVEFEADQYYKITFLKVAQARLGSEPRIFLLSCFFSHHSTTEPQWLPITYVRYH
jgi:hypothetical protein